MRCMNVWSAGSKTAKDQKIDIVLYSIIIIIYCIGIIVCFNFDCITEALFLLLIAIWFLPLMILNIKSAYNDIKENKLIPIFLFEISEFVKLGKIPDNMYVLYSDKCGVVLAMKEYENESKTFSSGVEYFYKFEDYYDKHAVHAMEMTTDELN